MQTYRERRPVAALAPYVTCVWVQQVARDSIPYTHRTIPNGSAEVVCAPGSLPRVVGPQTGPTEETLAPGTTVVGVRFFPGAAPSPLGVPASELVDLALESDELWGGAAAAFAEAVAAAASPREAAAALERNAGLIAGSTLLASAVPATQRPRIEGAGALGMGIAAASATAFAGPVVGLAGYATLAVAGAVAAAALGPFLIAVTRRGIPCGAAPANRLLAP